MGSGMLLAEKIKDFKGIGDAVRNIMNKIVGPIMIVIGAAALAYVIYLGILYAKAEDAGKRKDAQGRLIGAVVGLVIIIAGITLVYAVNWDSIAYSRMEAHEFKALEGTNPQICETCGLDNAGHTKYFPAGK